MDEHDWAERYHRGDPVEVWRLWKKAIRLVGRHSPELLDTIPRDVLERYDRERAARAKTRGKRRAKAR
jgi:hypothetical protein